MLETLKLLAVGVPVSILVDLVWIGMIANGFTLRMTVVDMIRGACICALTAVSLQAARSGMG